MVQMMRTYRELSRLDTFDERFEYLKLGGIVGEDTFGFDRWLNQRFYHQNPDWRHIRDEAIIRDNGCDLGLPGYEIHGRILVHHINPVTIEDLEEMSPLLFDLDNLICVSHQTHNAIHYGDDGILFKGITERFKGDTCPWR